MTPTDRPPELIDSKPVFSGKVFTVTADTIREGDHTYVREVVRHTGSAVIVPIFEDGTVALVKQYRHPARSYLLEVPAGTLNPGEAPATGAARELEEELGFAPGKLELLAAFFVSPGFCNEKMWLYLATDLTPGTQHLDDDEMIEVVRLPLSEALQMIANHEIEDAKTIVGLLLAAPRFARSISGAEYPAV